MMKCINRREFFVACGLLAATGTTWAAAAPTQQDAMNAIAASFNMNVSDFEFSAIEFFDNRAATFNDTQLYRCDLGVPIYPVHMVFKRKINNWAWDYDTHYQAFQRYGKWTLAPDSIQGDINGVQE